MDISLMQQVQAPMNMSTIELIIWVLSALGLYRGSEFGVQTVLKKRNGKKEFDKEAHDEICRYKLETLQAHIDNRFDKIELKLDKES